MNGLRGSLGEVPSICAAVAQGDAGEAEVLICPPATLLIAAAAFCHGTAVGLGGQDCHAEPSGPFTGDISAEMLKDAGAAYVILGHSERRAGHNETNKIVHAKAKAALRAGLAAIICVGETRAEGDAGDAMPIVGVQLAAYRRVFDFWLNSPSPSHGRGQRHRHGLPVRNQLEQASGARGVDPGAAARL
jgi:triosephosphate isomerase (TIM)